MKAAATRSLESLCNSYNNDLATISKSYPAGRHISYDFDANCECGAPHNPTRHLTWQSVRINCRGLAKRAAGDGCAPASRLGIKAPLFPNWSAAIITAMLIALSGAIGGAAHAEDANISNRRNAERTSFTNDEIKDGFFKIAFDAELQLGRRLARIRKFDEPVRVFVFDQADPKRRVEIAAVIDDIRARVDHLDVAMTDDIQAANLVVVLVRQRDLNRTISSVYGRDKAKQILRSLDHNDERRGWQTPARNLADSAGVDRQHQRDPRSAGRRRFKRRVGRALRLPAGTAGESGYSGIAAALVAHRLRGLLAEYSEVPVVRRARQIDHI